ncbi:nucleotide disphospho-sugar-binding domain-containing protein [Maritimibacter sp. UBA3975]|uniref:glycosyltransferase n=1 Tax=Maritimibacter sp. UBA3975 TaxID=1946833 RepID=UPI000C0968B9|nr:nucleotide disphospho-sugar-binding domain-containing protein [Maritimibacter sp. UBA3975]MAM61243.1 hypothetical protein [Maritimibacter sp.]|tara:strand:- start:2039 stop:3319 length:1281 start_codon:yes stop_codon:yes gene_type:complete
MPRILFSTIGSLGDLYPLLSVAIALRARGAECLFAVHADQAPLVEDEGFATMPNLYGLEGTADTLGLSEAELIRKTFDDPQFLFREILPFDLANVTRQVRDWMGEVDLVATTFQAEAARLAAELEGVPVASLILQPMMVFDPSQPPVIPSMPPVIAAPGTLGRLWNAGVLRTGMAGIRAMHGHRVNAARRELGLPRHRGTPWFDSGVRPVLRLGLYPSLLHDHPPVVDPPVTVTGFTPFEGDAEGLDPAIAAFLDAGSAPVVFTLGSNAEYLDQDFYAQSLAAARQIGRRAVLLTGKGWGGVAEGDDVIQRPYVPHQHLFPRSAAIVHHGGIGTFCRALEAGKPQLVVPFGTDQPDNAARAERMGLARTLPAKRYSQARATEVLGQLLATSQAEANAERAAYRMAQEDGPGTAAEAILSALSARPA